MNDRDLLELAAKAAGIEIEGDYAPTFGFYALEDGRGWRYWSPLNDDGDALRLAVKLCFSIEQWQTTITVRIGDELICRELSDGKMTRLELTRRAIVRAAAEIQRAKEAA